MLRHGVPAALPCPRKSTADDSRPGIVRPGSGGKPSLRPGDRVAQRLRRCVGFNTSPRLPQDPWVLSLRRAAVAVSGTRIPGCRAASRPIPERWLRPRSGASSLHVRQRHPAGSTLRLFCRNASARAAAGGHCACSGEEQAVPSMRALIRTRCRHGALSRSIRSARRALPVRSSPSESNAHPRAGQPAPTLRAGCNFRMHTRARHPAAGLCAVPARCSRLRG